MTNKILKLKTCTCIIIVVSLLSCDKGVILNNDETTLEMRGVFIDRGNFDFIESNCIEEIHFTGTYKFVEKDEAANPSGNNTLIYNLIAKGTGTGLITGHNYRWSDNYSFRTKLKDENYANASIQNKIFTRITGTEGAPSFKIVFVYKEYYNANGELTAVKMEDTYTECE